MYNRGVVVLLGPNFVALFSVKTRGENNHLVTITYVSVLTKFSSKKTNHCFCYYKRKYNGRIPIHFETPVIKYSFPDIYDVFRGYIKSLFPFEKKLSNLILFFLCQVDLNQLYHSIRYV